jgi:hypothetical protein
MKFLSFVLLSALFALPTQAAFQKRSPMIVCQEIIEKRLLFQQMRLEHVKKGLWVRRGDHFKFGSVNGDKVRMILEMLLNNVDRIVRSKAEVATINVADSVQGRLVSDVAENLGFNSIVGEGATPKLAEDDLERKAAGKSVFKVGEKWIGQTTLNSILNTLSIQAQALPKEFDHLVIPVGSGLTAAGILRGIAREGIKIKRVILVQTTPDWEVSARVKALSGDRIPFELVRADSPLGKNPEKAIYTDLGLRITLDQKYEARAYDWLEKNIDISEGKTVFWIIGNGNSLRSQSIGPAQR